MTAEMKAVHGHKSIAPSPKLTLLLPPPYLSTTETDVEPLIVHDFLRRPSSHLLAFDYVRLLLPWKGHQFILTKIDMFSQCGLTFPTCIDLVSTSIQELTECLIH